jgi:hypothetical protein
MLVPKGLLILFVSVRTAFGSGKVAIAVRSTAEYV